MKSLNKYQEEPTFCQVNLEKCSTLIAKNGANFNNEELFEKLTKVTNDAELEAVSGGGFWQSLKDFSSKVSPTFMILGR